MKRVLVAGVLGSLLLLGAPTLAASAPKSETKAEKGDGGSKGESKKSGDGKSGDGKSGDHKGGDKDRDGKGYGDGKGHDGKRDGHWRGRDGRHRHGHHRGGYYGGGYGYGYPGYYGDGYDCYYGPNGAYNCEEYGGDWDPYGYNYRGTPRDDVVIVRGGFSPQQSNIRVGQEVRWIFDDRGAPHNVSADNGSWSSGERRDGEFRMRFDHPGTYSYHDAVNPNQRGRVIVH